MMRVRMLLTVAALIVSIALAASTTGRAQPAQPTPPAHVGVVRIADVMNRYDQTNDLETVFRERRMQIDAETEKRQEALKQRAEELGRFKPDTPERLARERDLFRLKAEYEIYVRLTAAELDRQQRVWMQRSYQDVNRAAAEVAKARGFTMVVAVRPPEFDASDVAALKQQIVMREILYTVESVDVSDAVLARTNEAYTRRGGIRDIRARLDPLATP